MSESITISQLRIWLELRGFSFAKNSFADKTNVAAWYAWRRTSIKPVRECECNGAKIQIVLRPYSHNRDSKTWESVEVDVTGEASDIWFKLTAYSLSPDELVDRLDEIEASLVRAWNALRE